MMAARLSFPPPPPTSPLPLPSPRASALFRSFNAHVALVSTSAAVPVAPRKRVFLLSDVLAQLASGADVSSTLEPRLHNLTIEDWLVLVAEVGEKDWNNAWRVFSVLREKGDAWDQSLRAAQTKQSQNEETRESAPAHLKIYTTVARILAQNGRNEEIASLKEQMKEAGIEPDVSFYNALFESYAHQGLVTEISKGLLQMQETGIKPDHITYEKLILAHLREENMGLERPTQILKDMIREGLPIGAATFKNLIKAFWRAADPDGAEEIFEAMQLKGHTPDLKVITKLMQLHGRKGNFKRNVELLQMLKNEGIQPNASVYDYMLHAYSKAGLVEQARGTFLKYKLELGSRPSIVAFNMIIDACGKQGLHDAALKFYVDLCNSGIKPSIVSYNSIISAMVKGERFDKAQQLYRRMLKQKIKPTMHTYLIMIHCYTKCNLTRLGHELYTVLRESQIGMNDMAYGTVLALYVEGSWYGHAAGILQEIESKGFDLDVASHGLLIRCFGTSEETMTPLARAVQSSKFDVCKLLTALFLSNQKNPEFKHGLLNMVTVYLEKWNKLDDSKVKATIYNAILDCFWKKGLKGTARMILRQEREVFADYTRPQRHEMEWFLDVRGLSIGGGKVALIDWLGDAAELAYNGLVDDLKMVIITGGSDFPPQIVQSNSLETQKKGLKGALLSMLGELGSPFVESPDDARKLHASAAAVLKWISQDVVKQAMILVD